MLSEYFKIAVRSLSRRKIRSWLTMIGIFIGIAAVVSLIGLGEGLRFAITSQFGSLGTDVLSVQASGLNFAGPPGTGTPNPLSSDLAEKIEKVNNVDVAINRYIAGGTVNFNGKDAVGFAMSMPSGEKRIIAEDRLNLEIASGRMLKDADSKKVVLGNDFTKEDMFGRAVKPGDRIYIEGEQYEVSGIIKKKGSFIFDSIILMNEDDLIQTLKGGDDSAVNVIAVKVKDENQIEKTKSDIEKLLRKERDVKEGDEDFEVQSPQAALESLNSALFAVQLFVYIIAGISILVGGIGIMNTMYTSVLERTKEIGVMKSIGAKNSSIFTIFLIESGILGFVGGLIGVILGLCFAYGLAAVGRIALGVDLIQAHVSMGIIFGALAFSFILGTFFGATPAYQASKLQPVESLRSIK